MQVEERQHLIADLAHADEEVRRLGVERLSLLSAAEAIPLLLGSLADSSWRVRKAAVERLAALPERAGAVQALLDALADAENSGRRSAAAEALVRCGRSAVLPLLEALHSNDIDVRKQVVDVLGLLGDARAVDGLERALCDSEANVRAAAADALAALGAENLAAALTERFASDPEPFVRLAALRALVELESPLPLALLAPVLADPVLRNTAYAALGQSSDPATPEWIAKGLLSERASTREAAGEAAVNLVARAEPAQAAAVAGRLKELAEAHSEIVADVCERLENAAPARRLASIQLLGVLRSPAGALALLHAGADAALADAAAGALLALGARLLPCVEAHWLALSPAERAFAARALGAAPETEASSRLLLPGLHDESAEVRCAAARALASVGGLDALRVLFDRLSVAEPPAHGEPSEDEAEACVLAVLGIAERCGSEATDAVIELIEARLVTGAEGARLAGARMLTRLARPADATRLAALLTDASPCVRREVVESADRFGRGGDALLRVALADESPAVRAAAAAAIAAQTRAGIDDDLAALATDRDQRVRAAVMSALAQRAPLPGSRARAFELLAAGLASDGIVALAALASLDRVGTRDSALVALAGLASPEPEIAERAAACVGAHGGPLERAALLPLLAHSAWPVRARAASELGARRVAHAAPQLHARLSEEQDEFVREALLAALAELER